MTTEEILEYNKRCAEFLGWDYNKFMDRWNEDMHHQYSFVESTELKFHSDWNWIMEVVEAIEELFDGEVLVEISDESCYIGYHKEYEKYATMESKKEAVVQAINQFLIWYKENNK